MDPFWLIELLVFVTAETSLLFGSDVSANRLPWPVAAAEVFLFFCLRFALGWAKRSRRRTDAFFVAEIVFLVAIAANVTGAALIITSVSVCIRSVELVRPARDASAYTAVTLAIVLVAMAAWARSGGATWPTIAGWIVDLLLAWGLLGVLVTFAANERRNNDELRDAQRELIRFASEAADLAAIRERSRIALDLHDAIGHTLTALDVQLEGALYFRAGDAPRADAFVATAKALAARALDDVRATVSQLRVDTLERSPPPVAIGRVCDRIERDFALAISRDFAPVEASPVRTTALVRIAEEALVNVVRHAGTGHATVVLERADGTATLRISDRGPGLPRARDGRGTGLAIMRERAAAAALRFTAESGRDGGTQIAVVWPHAGA